LNIYVLKLSVLNFFITQKVRKLSVLFVDDEAKHIQNLLKLDFLPHNVNMSYEVTTSVSQKASIPSVKEADPWKALLNHTCHNGAIYFARICERMPTCPANGTHNICEGMSTIFLICQYSIHLYITESNRIFRIPTAVAYIQFTLLFRHSAVSYWIIQDCAIISKHQIIDMDQCYKV